LEIIRSSTVYTCTDSLSIERHSDRTSVDAFDLLRKENGTKLESVSAQALPEEFRSILKASKPRPMPMLKL